MDLEETCVWLPSTLGCWPPARVNRRQLPRGRVEGAGCCSPRSALLVCWLLLATSHYRYGAAHPRGEARGSARRGARPHGGEGSHEGGEGHGRTGRGISRGGERLEAWGFLLDGEEWGLLLRAWGFLLRVSGEGEGDSRTTHEGEGLCFLSLPVTEFFAT